MQPIVLYHAYCADGFGAAWAAWQKLGDDADYLPVRHGNPPPTLPEGASVYIPDLEIHAISAQRGGYLTASG